MTQKKTKLPLSKTHPKLAREAHGWDPSSNYSNSAKVMQWECKKRHKWSQSIRNRTNRGKSNYAGKCPVCNSVAVKFPSIAKEAYGWNPKKVSAKSSQKLKWKCKKEHIYLAMVYNRSNGSECPICLGRIVLKGFNYLKTTHPHLAKEADGWDPKTVTQGNNSKKNWKCGYGHKWNAAVGSRSK